MSPLIIGTLESEIHTAAVIWAWNEGGSDSVGTETHAIDNLLYWSPSRELKWTFSFYFTEVEALAEAENEANSIGTRIYIKVL